jgi:hypothetical protein
MATGFMARFGGKVKIGSLWLGNNSSVTDAMSGIAGTTDYVQKISLPVTATANTDIAPLSLPAGKTLLRATVFTGTAYGAATDAKIEIGVSAGDASYVAQTSIKAVGIVNLTLVAAAAAALLALPTAPNLYVRIVQTGTASATGAATLVLEYA